MLLDPHLTVRREKLRFEMILCHLANQTDPPIGLLLRM